MVAVLSIDERDPGARGGGPRFSIERGPGGDVILSVLTQNVQVEINVGRSLEDVQNMVDDLGETAGAALSDILECWEDTPEDRDGYVTLYRLMYAVQLDLLDGGMYPTQDIATYELARMMANAGWFPNAWYQGQVGYDDINTDIKAFLTDDQDKPRLKPLDGVVYDDGDTVMLDGTCGTPCTVVRDYGKLGVMMHVEGYPSSPVFAKPERRNAITPNPIEES